MRNQRGGRQASSNLGGRRKASPEKQEFNLLLDLQCRLMSDVADSVDYVDIERDIQRVISRYRHEGFAFLSKSLPLFGESFTHSLSSGLLSIPTNFKKAGVESPLPAFLQGLVARVFDNATGKILSEPDYTAVFAVRQICLFLKKYEVKASVEMLERDLLRMLWVDKTLTRDFLTFVLTPEGKRDTKKDLLLEIISQASVLLDQVFGLEDFKEIIPRHGPGATVDNNVQYEKFRFKHYEGPLGEYWPRSSYCVPSLAQGLYEYSANSTEMYDTPDSCNKVKGKGGRATYTQRCRENQFGITGRYSTVCSVPKDSGKTRTISEETGSRQWIQQGIWLKMAERIHDHPLTKGQIDFKSQAKNQRLALEGSKTGAWATIDWSEASDRISVALCKSLLKPPVFHALNSARAAYTRIKWPDGGTSTHRLNKMAPMGNAFCFPLESLLFWALSSSAIAVIHRKEVKEVSQSVFVFGDDTIVPSKFAKTVMTWLQAFDLKPNADKSFYQGKFRESCGMDAFDGVDVSILRVKTPYPRTKKDVKGLTSWVDYANRALDYGYESLATKLIQVVESRIGSLPILPYQTDLLAWTSRYISVEDVGEEERETDSRKPVYQGRFVSGWRAKPVKVSPTEYEFSEEAAWLRWVSYTTQSDDSDPFTSNQHREVARSTGSMRNFAVPNRTKLERGHAIVS